MSKNENPPRLGLDGLPVVDVDVNPKAVLRREREAAERAAGEAKNAARSALHWTRAMVEEAILENKTRGSRTVMNGEEIDAPVNLHGKNLDGEDLSGLDLENANFHGASCKGTRFVGSNLKGANFHGASLGSDRPNIDGANFSDCNLEGANFCQSCVCRCVFHGPKLNVSKANFSDCCCEALDGVELREIKIKDQNGEIVKRLVGDDRFDRANWCDAKRKHSDE